jgi:hypothetical protein
MFSDDRTGFWKRIKDLFTQRITWTALAYCILRLAQLPQFRAWREGSAKLKSTLQFVDPHLLGQVQLQHLQ